VKESRIIWCGTIVSLLLAALAAPALAADPHAAANWGYSGDHSPQHWGDLEPSFAACKAGTRQSPIDIKDAIRASIAPLGFSYKNGKLDVIDHDDSMTVDHGHGNFITIGSKKYKLLQLHFHRPAETTIGGTRLDMEAHLVHQSDDGEDAVVAILIRRGERNPAIEELPDAAHPDRVSIVAAALVPKDRELWRYNGSLTTPPCGEGALWNVMKTPIEMSAEQIEALSGGKQGNDRPIQRANGRFILEAK
jgi:carbonic anhydrase